MKFNLMDSLRNSIKQWLKLDEEIHSPYANTVNDTNILQKYLIYDAWAVGDTRILEEVYKELPDGYRNSFWKAVPDKPLCKRHTGIPKIILTSLVNIIAENFDGISFDNKYSKQKKVWESIETDNDFAAIVIKAVRDALVFGEGAFKLMYLPEVSKFPIITFVPAKKCLIEKEYGRLKQIVFYDNTYYDEKEENKYILKEYYKKGCIEYKLFNDAEKEVSLDTLPETEKLQDIYFSDEKFIAAIPYKIYDSDKYEGHGESIYAGGKIDIFDALDETLSQYIETIRLSKPKSYFPADAFEYDIDTGKRKINSTVFNPIYTLNNSNPLAENDKIQVVQSALNSNEYGQTISQLITLACSGLCSPSTISISLQNTALISNDSGEAQREKEKQTLYTINKIKNSLHETLPVVIESVLKLYGFINAENIEVPANHIMILFSEYANPSFEAQVETLKKAAPEVSIMTPEEIVQEKYGYTITEEEKAEHIRKLYIINYGVENAEELLNNQKEDKNAIQEIKSQQILNTNKTQATENRYTEK